MPPLLTFNGKHHERTASLILVGVKGCWHDNREIAWLTWIPKLQVAKQFKDILNTGVEKVSLLTLYMCTSST